MVDHPVKDQEETAAPPGSRTAYDNSWLVSVLRPVLIVIMVTCMSLVVLTFLRLYVPALSPTLRWAVLGFGLGAAIIGCTTTTWLAQPGQRLRRGVGYRLAEIVLILLVARLIVWVAQGYFPSMDALLTRPDEAFFDGPFLITAFVVAITWIAAIDFTDDLMQLALQPDEIRLQQPSLRGVLDTSRPAQGDRAAVLRRFVARWVGWGLFLILIASMLRMGITRDRFWTLVRQDVDPQAISAIVIYFLVGLTLISLGQLALLRARWTIDHLPHSASILRNWPVYTAAILILFGLGAALLPLGDTFLIATVLTAILNFLYNVIHLIYQLITLLIIFLLSLLPFSNTSPPPPAAPEPTSAATPPPLPLLTVPAWVGGVLFWTVILAILAVAAYFYFSDKQRGVGWLTRIWQMVRRYWGQLFGAWHAWRTSLWEGTADDGRGEEGEARRPWWAWPLRWRSLDPSQQVRYLYFQLLSAAAQANVARRPAETPATYAPRLSREVATETEESATVDALTEAFVQVRYAGQNATPEQAARLATLWESLRKKFSP